jgi:hypothetical protein
MEADWEVEIGGDAPVIDARWEGRVDLRRTPELAAQLPETREFPALARALAYFNSEGSPFWTSKCDIWIPGLLDPDELEATREEAKCVLSCYIDLLPSTQARWATPEQAVAECRSICARLRMVPLRCCRADVVVRQSFLGQGGAGVGVTAYLTSCGATPDSARATLALTLNQLVNAVLLPNDPERTASTVE